MQTLKLKADFPLFKTYPELVYLDSAATSQKPKCVIDALVEYYCSANANPHRGVYDLSIKSSERMENTRQKIAGFINAESKEEIIFTRGTTDSINSLALCLSRSCFEAGDEIIITEMEHHSNIVPWQFIAKDRKLKIKIVPINKKGELELDVLEKLINEKTKLIAVTYVSNAIGTINPVSDIVKLARKHNILTMIDGAQAVGHLPVDVRQIDADFFVFSGHKAYGPTGIGVLYGKKKLLQKLFPFQGGGGMIDQVFLQTATFASLPFKFEAGTPMAAEAAAFKSSFDYLEKIGPDKILAHEKKLLCYATEKLQKIDGLRIIGQPADKTAIVSFVVDRIHPLDISSMLDLENIAIRSGHHCAQPLHRSFGLAATCRASFGLYNTEEDINRLCDALQSIVLKLRR